MSIVYLTRRVRFNAAHKLWVSHWSDEKNMNTFGKCANKNWHGHNYILEVTVKGIPDKTTGFVLDAKKLNKLLLKVIVEEVDHKNLNLDVNWIPSTMMPTTENMTILIWNRLINKIDHCHLHRIKLIETENIWAEYYGPDHEILN